MGNEVEVLRRIRKSPPPELDKRVKRSIRRIRIIRYVSIYGSTFVLALIVGGLIGVLFSKPRVQGALNILLEENPHHEVYPGVVPIRVQMSPPGAYSYRVYLNGSLYKEGYANEEIDDSVILVEPFNSVDFQVEDLIDGGERNLSWVVFNF